MTAGEPVANDGAPGAELAARAAPSLRPNDGAPDPPDQNPFATLDQETTVVCAVPEHILELLRDSGDQTKSVQVPPELIELARQQAQRRRAERARSQSSSAPALSPARAPSQDGPADTGTHPRGVPEVDGPALERSDALRGTPPAQQPLRPRERELRAPVGPGAVLGAQRLSLSPPAQEVSAGTPRTPSTLSWFALWVLAALWLFAVYVVSR